MFIAAIFVYKYRSKIQCSDRIWSNGIRSRK